MELFILGPAFGLPSIDAECIAAVALLQNPHRRDWSLIPTHDDREGLPLLITNGQRIRGFKNIVCHLKADQQQSSDSVALASFLERSAQTLLDISLYVSFENYSATRSAFTQVLPWHTNYTLPPRRRAAARARTEHLGISSIDVDNVHEDLSGKPSRFDGVGKEQPFEVEAQKRASLLLPRKETLRSLLLKPERSAVFKLHALADHFFGPLQDMLGEKEFLGGAEMTSVDCLACGYLSLMLCPQLSQDWLATTMRRKYGKLVAYVERMNTKLEMQTSVEYVMSLVHCKSEAEVDAHRKTHKMTLPWNSPANFRVLDVLAMTAEELFSHVPSVSPSTSIVPIKADPQLFWQRQLPAIFAFSAMSLAVGITMAFRTGMLIWPRGEEVHVFGRKRFSDYGHLGAALAGMSVLSQQAQGGAAMHQAQEANNKAVLVDVEVEVDPVR